jgi:Domain of unknown function (DUF1963)
VPEDTVALTFLAQIDVTELPDFDGRQLLPHEGTLFFFCSSVFQGVPDPPCKVLYHPESVAALPQTSAPSDLMPLAGDGGDYQVKWLDKMADFHASVEFKYPLTFTVFDDFLADCPASNELLEESLRNALGGGEPEDAGVRSYERRRNFPQDDEWPFNWSVITHATRSVLHRAEDGLTPNPFRKPLSEDARETLLSVRETAKDWLDRACAHGPFRKVAAAEKKRFRAWRLGVAESYSIMAGKSSASEVKILDDLQFIIEYNIKLLATKGQKILDRAPQHYVEDLRIRNRWFAPCYVRGRYLQPSMAIHQILGYGKPVQGAPYEHRDDILLIQIQGDKTLFPWHSNIGCVLQFWIQREALLNYDFDGVEATLECD